MRDNSDRKSSFSSLYAPYRMTFDNHGNWRSTQTEVVPKYNSAGVWKVKLVISPEQLTEILSQESRTEALIESMRTVAKCGSRAPSRANSDKWSLASSVGNRVAHTLSIPRQIKQMAKGHDKI